jgi:hypothetical protein
VLGGFGSEQLKLLASAASAEEQYIFVFRVNPAGDIISKFNNDDAFSAKSYFRAMVNQLNLRARSHYCIELFDKLK